MIKLFFKFLSTKIFILILRTTNWSNQNNKYNDLNFKQNDFTNYKIVKHYLLKENFIYNTIISDVHTFDFLLFFQKLGGKKGIDLSKKYIFLWFKKYKYYNKFPWSDDYPSKRLINIIYNYDFICSASNKKEINFINLIINFHKRRIAFETKFKKIEELSSYEVLSQILVKSYKGKLNIKIIDKTKDLINSQLDEISMHKSYNILEHAKFLNNLIEIKNIFLFLDLKFPNFINNSILAMTSLLKTYRHEDLSLPLYNGANNNHNDEIKKLYEKEQFLKNNPLTKFKNGLAVYKDSKKTLFFDVVQPTIYKFHKELSAGTLAIEISIEGEKIITNCGGSESIGKNPSYLKYSAAHSTIIINNTNISEIKERSKNYIFPKDVIFESQEKDGLKILSGTHNGYNKNFNKICKRKIIINKERNQFNGEDSIVSTKSNIDKKVFHIRFHLMPEISTIITENKKNIIIRTKKNNMFMFKSNKQLTIDKSIFVKNDTTIETTQIVISGTTSSLKEKIKWSLEKT